MPDAAPSVLGGADAGDDPAVLALCFVGDTTLFSGNTEGAITIWSGPSNGLHPLSLALLERISSFYVCCIRDRTVWGCNLIVFSQERAGRKLKNWMTYTQRTSERSHLQQAHLLWQQALQIAPVSTKSQLTNLCCSAHQAPNVAH